MLRYQQNIYGDEKKKHIKTSSKTHSISEYSTKMTFQDRFTMVVSGPSGSNRAEWTRKMFLSSFIQSTLVISNSKGLSEILRDIRSSTYQVCRIEEKII